MRQGGKKKIKIIGNILFLEIPGASPLATSKGALEAESKFLTSVLKSKAKEVQAQRISKASESK